MSELEKGIGKAYKQFFEDMGIHKKSGIIRNKHLDLDKEELDKKKFATYPYIGSKYGKNGNAEKILFVGRDIGKGCWKLGHIQRFSERREGIEDKDFCCHNYHIAGTYMAVLYFLKDKLGWSEQWKEIVNTGLICKSVLNDRKELLPSEDPLPYSKNPLSYCALTNYHKFMTKGEKNMRHGKNLKWLCPDKEKGLFREEIEIFDPNIVIFQGSNEEFRKAAKNLKSEGKAREIYVGYHPAYVPAQKPEELIKSIRAGEL